MKQKLDHYSTTFKKLGYKAPKKKKKHTESDLQIECVALFYKIFKGETIISIPNEAGRINGSKLIAMGLFSGAADTFIIKGNSQYHGFFIEFKSPVGIQRKNQKEFEKIAESQGYKYIICKSVGQFYEEVSNYFKIK